MSHKCQKNNGVTDGMAVFHLFVMQGFVHYGVKFMVLYESKEE